MKRFLFSPYPYPFLILFRFLRHIVELLLLPLLLLLLMVMMIIHWMFMPLWEYSKEIIWLYVCYKGIHGWKGNLLWEWKYKAAECRQQWEQKTERAWTNTTTTTGTTTTKTKEIANGAQNWKDWDEINWETTIRYSPFQNII